MNQSHRVVFRVDESAAVGFGHMNRCRALAQALLDEGASVLFACCRIRAASVAELASVGIETVVVADEADFFARLRRTDVVVVDGYHFSDRFWDQLLAAKPTGTVCIDDYRGVHYRSDIVISYNEGVPASRFSLEPTSKLMLGGRYLLLRPEICNAAAKPKRPRPRRAVMLACGGTRQESWLSRMLRLLNQSRPGCPVWVLTGRKVTKTKVLAASGTNRRRLKFFTNLTAAELVALYRQARCLITPASTLMLEAFAAGVPVVTGWVAENQRNSLDFYARKDMIVNLGDLHGVTSDRVAWGCDRAIRKARLSSQKQTDYMREASGGKVEIVDFILQLWHHDENPM